jgi:hypothetical protein
MKRYVLFVVLMVLTASLLTACHLILGEAPEIPPITPEGLVGTWIADYSQYTQVDIRDAKEIIVLHSNGTFSQEFQTKREHLEENSGRWRAEDVNEYRTRIYLDGAIYYPERFLLGGDPASGITAWDNVTNQHVEITGGRGVIILYARRLLLKSESPCGREYDLVLEHLPIGDLDAPEYVTFYRECSSD